MPTTPTSLAPSRPPVDEWGLYDPEKAGLTALFHRLATPEQAALIRSGGVNDAASEPEKAAPPLPLSPVGPR